MGNDNYRVRVPLCGMAAHLVNVWRMIHVLTCVACLLGGVSQKRYICFGPDTLECTMLLSASLLMTVAPYPISSGYGRNKLGLFLFLGIELKEGAPTLKTM